MLVLRTCIGFAFLRNRRISVSLFLACIAFFCGTSSVFSMPDDTTSDTVILVNGDRISGHLVSKTGEFIIFRGSLTGTLRLKRADVQELKLDQLKVSILGKSSVPAQPSESPESTTLTAANLLNASSSTGSKMTGVSFADLLSDAHVDSSQDGFLQSWIGQLQSQSSVIASTQHQYQVGGSLHLGRATSSQSAFEHQATSIDLQASFGESAKPKASPVKTDLYEGVLQHNVYLTDKGDWRAFVLADFYHNLSLGMNFQQSFGAGVGRDWQYGLQTFGFSGDIRFEGQYLYAPGQSENLGAVAASQFYSVELFKIKNKPLSFLERTTFIPAFENSHALQARGLVRLTLPISPRLSIGLQENDDYLRNAPPTSRQNYSNSQITFSYIFGPLPK
jgi:hypothetical protein